MSDNKQELLHNRRQLLKGALGASVIAATVPSQWVKPVVNSVLTPAHAQTSPPPMCPMAVLSMGVTGPVSGQGQCTITFDVLSSDPAQPLTISSITDNSTDPSSVTYDGFGTATDTTGPRIVWQGPTIGGELDCSQPVTDVTFTITASCAANSDPFTQTFNLSEVAL